MIRRGLNIEIIIYIAVLMLSLLLVWVERLGMKKEGKEISSYFVRRTRVQSWSGLKRKISRFQVIQLVLFIYPSKL